MTNNLAYNNTATITAVKSFKEQALGVIKLSFHYTSVVLSIIVSLGDVAPIFPTFSNQE